MTQLRVFDHHHHFTFPHSKIPATISQPCDELICGSFTQLLNLVYPVTHPIFSKHQTLAKMRCFQNVWSFCISKTEKEAVASDDTSAPRPIKCRNESSSKNETTPEKIVPEDTSPKPVSGTETVSSQAKKSEPVTSQLPLSSDKNVNPAEVPPTKDTVTQKLVTSNGTISSREENGTGTPMKGQPSTIAEIGEDGTTGDQRLRKSFESTHTNLGIDFSTGFDAAVRPNVIPDDDSKKLASPGAPGSPSTLIGLTPDGKKEAEADSSPSKPEPAQSVEAWSGDKSGDLLTASFGRGVMNVPEIPSTSGSSVANDGVRDSLFSTWAAANASVATDCVSSSCAILD